MEGLLKGRRLKLGVGLICVSALPGLVLGSVFSVGLVFFDMKPPILCIALSEPQLEQLGPEVLPAFKDLAILFNGVSVIAGILILVCLHSGTPPRTEVGLVVPAGGMQYWSLRWIRSRFEGWQPNPGRQHRAERPLPPWTHPVGLRALFASNTITTPFVHSDKRNPSCTGRLWL